MNTRSIRFQLVVWYTTLLGAVFTLFGFFVYAALHHFLSDNLNRSLHRYSTQIVTSIETERSELDQSWFDQELSSHYAPETTGRFIRVTLVPDAVLYISGAPKDGSFDPDKIPRVPAEERESLRKVSFEDGREILIRSLPVKKNGKLYFLEVGGGTGQVDAVSRSMLLWLLGSIPLVFATAALGAYVLVGRALKPVERITGAAERITLHSLEERLPVSQTGDELENLSLALNRMITRIDDAYEYTRRFIADASHELRTPLTILRGELEHVLNTHHLNAEARETLASNLEEVERLGKIVEGLFALSRLDAGEAQAETVKFDLTALAQTTTEQMCLLAEDKGISLQCDGPSAVFIEGDRARLKQVIVNLLDNAIKYTPEGGRVLVRTSAIDNKAILEVADNGLGIPAGALPHVFERFYRVEKGRSRELGGAGLGLSIVKSICAAHHATVAVESREGEGSTFRVTLPLMSPARENVKMQEAIVT
jgi:heavy metal sensor kinase